MDSRMIDVVIGLVLVFALTGLAVSTLHEVLVSFTKARGRNLEFAIRSMLGDGKDSGFAASLLKQPLIASLTDKPMIGTGKPSYIGADVLVTALVAQLTRLYCAGVRPDTPQALVSAVRLGRGRLAAPEPSAELMNVMDSLLDGTDGDWNTYLKRLCAWYDSVAERSIGWFRRATQMRLFLVGLTLAAVININPFVIAPRLWNDEALRKASVDMAQRASAAFGAETAASAPAAAQLQRVLAALEPTAGHTPAAATGAHAALQAEVDLRLAALGQSLIALMNTHRERGSVELLAQLQPLFGQPALIEKFIHLQRAAAVARDRDGLQAARGSVRNRLVALSAALDDLKLQEAAKRDLLARQAELVDAVAAETRRVLQDTLPSDQRFCRGGGDEQVREVCERLAGATTGLGFGGLPVGWVAANLPDCERGPCSVAARRAEAPAAAASAAAGRSIDTPVSLPRGAAAARTALALDFSVRRADEGAADPGEVLQTLGRCVRDLNCASISVAGWLVTALAAVLGAPFWFDLLGKLIKLRGAGGRPGDDTAGGKSGGGAPSPAGPDGVLSTPPTAPDAGPAPPTMRDVQTLAESQLSAQRVRELQVSSELKRFGAQPTGFFDESTRRAILAWQQNVGQPETGELTQDQIDRLLSPSTAAAAAAPVDDADEHHPDNCGCDTHSATPDEALPAAQGGVSTS